MTHEGHHSISAELAIYKRIRAEIAGSFGLNEDDQAVRDTVEGETSLIEMLERLMRIARVEAAEAKGCGEVIKEIQARKARKEHKAERLRAIVLHAMEDADIAKLAMPDMTVSRQRGQRAVIITADVAGIPDEFCRVSREPDKVKIKAALRDGDGALTFAHLGNAPETLVVRGA